LHQNRNWQIVIPQNPEVSLGWLILEPKAHYIQLTELGQTELLELGIFLEQGDLVLQKYLAPDFIRKLCFENKGSFHLTWHFVPSFKTSKPTVTQALLPPDTKELKKRNIFYQKLKKDYQL
jgi:diadenosine tetraphosphate (Ap4A) HIT family hydrolase